MRYELMFSEQMRRARDEGWPVVLAAGVLEYHGEHCVFGVDGLLVERTLDRLQQERDMVVLPPLYYGPASYAVAGPEQGTLHVDADVVDTLARQIFLGLLRTGFRNIHVFLLHQSEDFQQGMPMDLAFRTAARRVIFEFLEKERGEGWWGSETMKNYLADHQAGKDPFSWIRIHPLLDAATLEKFPLDHAGVTETSLMMALCPEGANPYKLSSNGPWYCQSASEASVEHGEAILASALEGMRKALS